MPAITASPGSETPSPVAADVSPAATDGRMIDPRGHRFGAGVSVVILATGFILGLPLLTSGFLAIALGVSAAFGTKYSILGRPWPYVRKALRIAPPRELEHEYPPRFAQALGFVGFSLATVMFLVGFLTVGWIIAAAVGGLQAVLAVSGYCLGCRMYFLKWWVPAQFQKLARRTTIA